MYFSPALNNINDMWFNQGGRHQLINETIQLLRENMNPLVITSNAKLNWPLILRDLKPL